MYLLKWNKTRNLIMMASLIVVLLAGCTGKSEPNKPSAVPNKTDVPAPVVEQKKEISVSILDRGEVSSDEGSYENNRWTKWINENAPAKVKWVPVPRTQVQQKLNTLIASGTAPDLIWEYDRSYISQLAAQGAIQPIDEYIEKYSTTYKAYLAKHPELKPFLTINGKMYAIASARGQETIANHGIMIRQDWLDKLGLKAPTTVEELFEVARKFKEGDPDGNGTADTVPITFNYNGVQILRALFFNNENQWYLEDGKLTFGRILDRYTDSLALQKQLFDEGLIDKEYITDTNFQRSLQLWTTGKSGIYLGSWSMGAEFVDLKKNVPDAKVVPLEPVASKYGKNGLYQEVPANMYIAFNTNMKEDKIEAGVKFLDWMLEKGWEPLRIGEKDVHYKLVGEVPQKTDADKFKKEVFYAREYAILNEWDPKPEWYAVMAAQDPISQEQAVLKAAGLEIAMKNKYRRDIAYNPDLPEVSQLIATFAPIAQQIEAKIVTGGGALTPQAGMEDIRKEWKRLGGENVEKLVQEWYETNKEHLK